MSSADKIIPGQKWATITPHDSTNISPGDVRAVYVGGAGTVVAVGQDDTAISFVGVTAGSVLPISPKRINSTGTTATELAAIY